MKLSEIEEVGYLLTAYDEEDVYEDGDINYDIFEFHRDNYTQNDLNKCGLTQWDFCDCQALYTAEQMKEYAEVKRDYILIIDGGIGTKLYATDRFTGTEAVDVYGDKYKVVNHVKNGKMWVLDNEEDTKND